MKQCLQSLKKSRLENSIFIDIENDGFKLSSQRKEHHQNDLPEALEILKQFKTLQKLKKNSQT